MAKSLREDFLQQNAFSEYDYTCPIYKSVGMLKCFIRFYNAALRAIKDSAGQKEKLTYAAIKTALGPLIEKLAGMKFQDPMQKEEYFNQYFEGLCLEIDEAFQSLSE